MVIIFRNKNTTIGCICFNDKGEDEYLFVNPAFSKQGLVKKLSILIKEKLSQNLTLQEPISRLGKNYLININ